MSSIQNTTNSVQDNSLLDRLSAGLKKTTSEHKKELDQADFFELMIAQLKNQDPTKPFDAQQQVAQMAQFSSVNGIQELNKSFTQLAQSLQSLGALQASSLVGRSVMIDSGSAYVVNGAALQGKVNLTENVNDLTISLYDSSGIEVRRLSMGNQAKGDVSFSWDGLDSSGAQVPPGTYRIKAQGAVVSKTTDGNLISKGKDFAIQVQASVQSVSLGQSGQSMTLNLAGLGTIDVSKVKEIL